MNKTELRAFALGERDRRRLVQRDYELPADGPVAPKVTVSAAVVADNPYAAELYQAGVRQGTDVALDGARTIRRYAVAGAGSLARGAGRASCRVAARLF